MAFLRGLIAGSLVLLPFGNYAAADASASTQQISVPLFYSPIGDLGKAATNISWGTPKQPNVTTTFDTGSRGFWVDTQVSNIVSTDVQSGSQCTYPVRKYYPIYNYTASKSHSPIVKSPPQDSGFSYGNSKSVNTPTSLNDTMSWNNGASLKNQRVALAQNTSTQVQGSECSGPGYSTDVSILGMGLGSSWRADLLANGLTKSLNWSIWFDKSAAAAPIDIFRGTALMDKAPPASSYNGTMVTVPLANSQGGLFYTVARPTLKVGSKEISTTRGASTTLLLDTGTITDMVPFSHKDMVAANVGLIYYVDKGGFIYFSYNGSCSSIPNDLTLDYTFRGLQNENITIKVPIRNYATGPVPKKSGLCNLGNIETDNVGTSVFGIPFFTAATIYFQDNAKVVGLAQGGVA